MKVEKSTVDKLRIFSEGLDAIDVYIEDYEFGIPNYPFKGK